MTKRIALPALALLLLWTTAQAQIHQVRLINLRTALDTGGVMITLRPSSSADSTSLFDGDPASEFVLAETGSLSVTLEFSRAVTITRSTVSLRNEGQWKLEGALTTVDLDRRHASYRLLGDWTPFSSGTWSELTFPSSQVRCIRLSVRQSADTTLHFGEWTVEEGVTITRLMVTPCPVRLQPGNRMRLDTRSVDDRGHLYRTQGAGRIQWSVKDSSVALVDPTGVIVGRSPGSTTVSVHARDLGLAGSARVTVEPSVRPPRAAPLTIKVVLVVQDPLLSSGRHLHQEFKWRDPRVLAGELVRHFREATDSVVNLQIVETIEAERLFTRMGDSILTYDRFVGLLREPKWKSLREASDSGKIAFDYRAFVRHYGFDERRNRGEIDEVWVFAAPFLGMYESQLLGPRAFWWNSPPIKDGTLLTRLLSVMGLNYERGIDLAIHSFGHRIESAVIQAYQDAENRPWNNRSPDPTAWDLFTRIEKDCPGQSHVGNIHFPPNGAHDYDYKNERRVVSFAQNWVRYPYLYHDSSEVNVATWIHPSRDSLAETREHLGYLRWWFGYLPRYAGATAGVLNNWWHYVFDYESAVALGRHTASDPCP